MQETNRHTGNVDVDARTAWELYYPPFEAPPVIAVIGLLVPPLLYQRISC